MDESTSTGPAPSRWVWIAAIWLGVGLFDATQTVLTMRAEGMHHAWLRLFFTLLFAWAPLAVATPVILNLARKFPPFLEAMGNHRMVGPCERLLHTVPDCKCPGPQGSKEL